MCGSKIVTVLGFALCALARGSCSSQTAAEAMVSLRTTKGCTNPATKPIGCASSPNKEPKVTCKAANKALWDGLERNGSGAGNWSGAASDCIKVTPDKQEDWSKHDFHYPSGYADTCDQAAKEPGSYHCTWVANQTHSFVEGVGYNAKWDSEKWCLDKFRWVDPCTCDRTDIAKSSWLEGYYSYSACGASDKYTKTTCTAADKTKCTATAGCKWTDPVVNKCTAQTGAEAMVSLRKAAGCTKPATIPSGCATSPNKEAKVTCNTAHKALWDGSGAGTWSDAASDCIKVTPDKQKDWGKHDFHYPSGYANTCTQAAKEPGSYHCTWVANKTHSFDKGDGYNSKWDSETWCLDEFRWVDPCTCDKLDIAKSSWLTGYYSYSACGATDKYTEVSCGDIKDETKCVATSGCKWPKDNAVISDASVTKIDTAAVVTLFVLSLSASETV